MKPVDLVVIGASLGGLDALRQLLGRLPGDFATPIVIAQHRIADNGSGLCDLLVSRSTLPVTEVCDRQRIEDGHVYLAPPDYHVIVQDTELALSTEGRVTFARPSIDVLFESAAHVYRDAVVAVVLTGSSHDGASGAATISRRGGTVIVQSPQTAASPVAPRAAIERASPTLVGSIEDIAQWLGSRCRRGVGARKRHERTR